MIKDYYCVDINRTYDFIHDECGYRDDVSTEEIIYDLIHNDFCKYINKKGKNIGQMCQKKIRRNRKDMVNSIYCHFHAYREKKCFIKSCDKKCKEGFNYCKKHIKFKTVLEDVKDEYVLYNSKDEEKQIESYNNIDLYTNLDYMNKVDNFICYYPYLNISKINLCNDYTLRKNYFEHKSIYEDYENQPIIRYNRFSLMKYLYNLYNNFKTNIYNFVKKHNINICFLYYLILLIKEQNEKVYSKDIVLYQKNNIIYTFNNNIYRYIDKIKYDNFYNYLCNLYNSNNINIINNILKINDNNQIIIYSNNFKKRLKKYIENKKRRIRQKKKKQNKDKQLNIKYIYVKVSTLNNELLNEKIDSGWLNIKIWPMGFDYYKHFLNYEIKYFHCYYTSNIKKKNVVLFYKNERNIINYKEITYKELYDLLIREFNKDSIIDFIKYYYKNDDLLKS